jgi:acetylornithine/N-succinyldiaminopimelate aminotransferase
MNSAVVIKKVDKYTFSNYARYPIAIKRSKGCWVWDYENKKYLDFTTGIAVNNLGHNHPNIKKSLRLQSKKLIHVSNLFYTAEQAELAELLVKNSFAAKVFFCNTGTEANEAAIKIARKWGKLNGNRHKIIASKGGFHGRSYGSLSVTGNSKYKKDFTPMLPGIKFVKYGDITDLANTIIDKKVCALILEPIQGENGVILPPDGYFKQVRELCNNNNVLLILDEIQVGIGRTGKLFSYEGIGIKPDIMTIAKALGGGLPCGAVLATNDIAACMGPGTHGTTMGGNPLAMKIGYTVLRTIIEDGLLDNVSRLGPYFIDNLKLLSSGHTDIIKEVRGNGFIIGLEISDPRIASALVKNLYKNGLLTIITEQKVIRILPPLITTKSQIDIALGIIKRSIIEVSDA